jgi:regulator of protease activity HflC (stomatin/prohibitin superfamily)
VAGVNEPKNPTAPSNVAIPAPKTGARRLNSLRTLVLWAAVVVAALVVVSDAFYSVSPNERANVRRFGGQALYKDPIQPGSLYFKIPFVDKVDRVQVALTTQEIDTIDVGTVDNQRVTLDLNFNFTIPDDRVNYILYSVGQAGNFDIRKQVARTVESVAVSTFAKENMNNVNANLEHIREGMQSEIATALYNLYGIQTHSLQIAKVRPSEVFLKSNEAAVNAKTPPSQPKMN